jgi:hypothetical protein
MERLSITDLPIARPVNPKPTNTTPRNRFIGGGAPPEMYGGGGGATNETYEVEEEQ